MNKYQQKSNGFLKTLAIATVGAGIGYMANSYLNPRDGFQIEDGQIYRDGVTPRTITIENGVIQTGSLKERVNDLLYENPTKIKKTVEELYNSYVQESD